MTRFKTGLLPWRDDSRHLQAVHYLTSALPAPNPAGVDWSVALTSDWLMLGNDTQGDCFWAMMAHYFMCVSANAGVMAIFDAPGVLAAYHDCCGSGDDGTDPVVGLNYCRTVGMKDVAGKVHKIGAWVQVNAANPVEIAQAMDTFGPLAYGLTLPNSWESASLWDKATDDGSTAGGHAILGVGRDRPTYPIKGKKIVTWGMEDYLGDDDPSRIMMIVAMVSQDWIADTGLAPSGLDMKTLITDLTAVTAR